MSVEFGGPSPEEMGISQQNEIVENQQSNEGEQEFKRTKSLEEARKEVYEMLRQNPPY